MHGRSASVSQLYRLDKFSILYFNARSILPKLDGLYLIAETQNPSMICIVVSWLSDEIIDCELSIENYTLTKLDRNRHGGGLLVYVHASLNWENLLESSELEFLALSISYLVMSNIVCHFWTDLLLHQCPPLTNFSPYFMS